MDVAYINPFILSTIETFKKMLNNDIKPGKVAIKNDATHTYDVSGVIGLSGEAQGSICLSFPLIALRWSRLSRNGNKIIGAEVADAIGELANIIAGNAKQHLTQFNLSISPPKVIMGTGHKIASQRGVPTIIVPFSSSLGEFVMEVSLKTPERKNH